MNKQFNRKPLRLESFDYSSNGAYFITICTHQKKKTLGAILRRGDPCGLPRTNLSPLGKLAEETISEIEQPNYIKVDNYVVMPNHIHMIIMLSSPTPDSREGCHYGIPQVVSKYKSLVANKWLSICKSANKQMGIVWQRSYYDHIIRNETDYLKIWNYIDENPLKWEFDKYYR